MTKKRKTSQALPSDSKKKAAAQKQIESLPDPYALSQALMRAYEQSQPLFQKMTESFSQGLATREVEPQNPDPLNVSGAFIDLISALSANPMKHIELQLAHSEKLAALWANSIKKFYGEEASSVIEPQKGDRRFKADEWSQVALFDFIKQYYLLANEYVQKTIEETDGLDTQEREKLKFVSRLLMDALSPSNFVLTNPEVLRETIKTGGENLVKGLENLNKDMERGHGELKISTTNYDAFKLGSNIATTPGAVVFENDLIQLIQYKPSTKTAFKKPLLIIPPWINKYYILDLTPESSYIKWAVAQGHTVFCISWVNPDAKLAQKTFSDYMKEGLIEALDQIENITGEKQCNAVGYCLGGTLLATALAYLSVQKKPDRIASATFLTTLIDFEKAGDMKLFMDDQQIDAMEKSMSKHGILQAKELQRTFSLLRANDLIWSFVINNYLMGKEPFPFDLLFWNDDSTNMPAAMHSFYLKNMYRDNLLAVPGGLDIDGIKIDMRTIKTPCYFLSTKEDHIAPWEATYRTTQLVGGPKTFTLAASGHIAGVINPPSKNKYCYWSASKTPEKASQWLENAKEYEGSWWPHWENWIEKFAGDKAPARNIKKGIEPAPGTYVRKSAG